MYCSGVARGNGVLGLEDWPQRITSWLDRRSGLFFLEGERAKRGGRSVTCERSELRFASCSERMALDLLDPEFPELSPAEKF